jgi:hypothetical protein
LCIAVTFYPPLKKKYSTFAYAAMAVERKISVFAFIEQVKSDMHKGSQNKTIV